MNSVAVARRAGSYLPKGGVRLTPRRLLLSGAALILAMGAAYYGHEWWTVGRFIETTDDAFVGGDITVIAPRVSGLIAEVAVADNQAVHAGDLLVRLDDRDYRAALAHAEAAVSGQRATLANLAATRHLQDSVIAESEAGVASADAEIARARDDQARYRQLSATAAASVQMFERADAGYKQAVANGAKARASVDAARRQLDVIDTQTQQAEAALAGAIADRDTARLNVQYTELRSPLDGTVGNRSAHAGAFAAVGAQLVSIVPAKGLWVDANFKENQLTRLRPGLPVTIHADVMPGETFHGHVTSLAPATGSEFSVLPPENATGNFTKIVQRVPVRVVLDEAASELGRLRPGLSVTADIDERVP